MEKEIIKGAFFKNPKGARARFKDAFQKVVQNNQQSKLNRQTMVVWGGGRGDGDKRLRKNLAYYDQDIYNALKLRKLQNVYYNKQIVTPKALTDTDLVELEDEQDQEARQERSESLWEQLLEKVVKKRKSSLIETDGYSLIPDMDDITTEPIDRTESTEILDIESTLRYMKEDRCDHPSAKKPQHFFKLVLTESDDIVLYECASLTVPKQSEEAAGVEKYNKDYEFLTKGSGKNRRTSNAEVQTGNHIVKSRSANTDRIKKLEQGSFVSNFEMYDTYKDLATKTKEISLDDDTEGKITLTTYSHDNMENIDEMLSKNENFSLSSMILQRLLAGNVFRERQKRFRNMVMPNPLDLNVKYLYRLETLWTYKSVETMGKDIVDMSWCHDNGDLLAVAYGAYNYRESRNRISGCVCIWSIKNPVNPERKYRYKVPVTAVAFSKTNPQLLAIALYNGNVEVIDITENRHIDDLAPVAKSERTTSPGFEPIWQIQWLQLKDNKEHFLTASQDGRIMKYTMASGPHLVGYRQLRLDRVEGVVEALSIEHKKTFIEADRHPQALCLQIHPLNPDVYFVGTDEGCVHICSTNYPHQHTGVLQVHNGGGVYTIDFSPFAPKIFLTCGSDWFIRIWIEDIFEPILELSDGFGAIHNAFWSPIHSTIIASCTQDSVQIWDLRRKNLKPASVRTFANKKLTVIKFSPCGRSLVVGDTEGNTHICALEDFPFCPHYQYKELQNALYRSLANKNDLEKQVKQLGYLGYDTERKDTTTEWKCK